MTDKLKIGFAVITYNRPKHLQNCLSHLFKYTTPDDTYQFAVFDDGSPFKLKGTDKVKVFQGKTNQGVIVNKNRSLYYFTEINPVDVLITLEDDTLPYVPGWEQDWIKSTLKFGHINYQLPEWSPKYIRKRGTGEWDSPHDWAIVTGQVHGILTKYIKETVGYLNPRFRGYGHGHVEWTQRLVYHNIGGSHPHMYKSINKGVKMQTAETHRDEEEVARNDRLKSSLSKDFVPLPWVTEEQKDIFMEVF